MHESFTSEDTVGYTFHMHEMPVPERLEASTKVSGQRKGASVQPRTCDVFSQPQDPQSTEVRGCWDIKRCHPAENSEAKLENTQSNSEFVLDTAEGVHRCVHSAAMDGVLTAGQDRVVSTDSGKKQITARPNCEPDQRSNSPPTCCQSRRPNWRQNSHPWSHLQST